MTRLISTINSLSLIVSDMKTAMNDLVFDNKKQEIGQMEAEKTQTSKIKMTSIGLKFCYRVCRY